MTSYSDHPLQARRLLLERARHWIVDGIEVIQLREKHLAAGDLFSLAKELVRLATGSDTKVLINSRSDVALAAGAHGVHLTADPGSLRPADVRTLFVAAAVFRPWVSVSCHTVAEIERAVADGADCLLFGPVFEKQVGAVAVREGVGIQALRAGVMSAREVPLLALGGVHPGRYQECLAAGAVGVAGIRLFT